MHLKRSTIQKISYPEERDTPSPRIPSPADFVYIHKKTSINDTKYFLKSALKMHLRRSKIQKFSYLGEEGTPSPRTPSPMDFVPVAILMSFYSQKKSNK